MKAFRIAAILAFALALPLSAQEPKDSEKLVALTFTSTAMQAAKAAFSPFLDQARQEGIPEAGIKEIAAAADAFFKKTFEDPELHKEMANLYEQNFSSDELQTILAFYDTPVGRKALATMPVLAEQGAQIGKKYAAKNQAGFQQELQGILTRYQKPAGGGAPPAPEAKPDKK